MKGLEVSDYSSFHSKWSMKDLKVMKPVWSLSFLSLDICSGWRGADDDDDEGDHHPQAEGAADSGVEQEHRVHWFLN